MMRQIASLLTDPLTISLIAKSWIHSYPKEHFFFFFNQIDITD